MLVVDIDGGRLLHSYGDECDIIPRKLHKALVSAVTDDSCGNTILALLLSVVHTCIANSSSSSRKANISVAVRNAEPTR